MTDSKEKKTDKKTEHKDLQQKKSKVSTKKKSPNTASNAGPYIFVFCVAIATAAGLYFLWEKQQQNLIQQNITSQQVEEKINNVEQLQISSSKKNESLVQEIYSNQETLHNNLSNLIRNNQQLRKDWLMAEAEYLIQLANYRLLLEKDVTTAMVALKTADTRLAETADPAILEIRKILASDIQKLSNIPKIDLAGLSITISALSKNINNLPLNTPDPKSHQQKQEENVPATTEVKSLKDLPAAIWQDLKSLVVIRSHKKPLQPLLPPNQKFFLEQNLGLILEQARLALLNNDNEIYQERLAITAQWIQQYFDTEHNVTRNMLASISELQKFDIDPTLPDISSSFSLIKKYRTHGQQPKTVTTKANK